MEPLFLWCPRSLCFAGINGPINILFYPSGGHEYLTVLSFPKGKKERQIRAQLIQDAILAPTLGECNAIYQKLLNYEFKDDPLAKFIQENPLLTQRFIIESWKILDQTRTPSSIKIRSTNKKFKDRRNEYCQGPKPFTLILVNQESLTAKEYAFWNFI